MLIERLNWPVRLVRWRAAREYGALLASNTHSKKARGIFLDWLSSRQLESQVTSALSVLLCTPERGLPTFREIGGHISRPSLLSELLLQFVYGWGNAMGGWERCHSGEAPPSFEATQYFHDHKSAHVPPILSNQLAMLEKTSGFPFERQWAFEWQQLTEKTGTPKSGYPYYFVDAILSQSGIHGQFSQAQADVFSSAFLRTLACAVDCWDMPASKAAFTSMYTLPANRGLLNVDPIDRPTWLNDLPEKCCVPGVPLEPLVRRMVATAINCPSMRPINLKIPISADITEFGELTISAILASPDFIPDLTGQHTTLLRALPWELADRVTFSGKVAREDIATYTSRGIAGAAAPLCLDIYPLPSGFWHNDYFQIGVSFPAPYFDQQQIAVVDGSIQIRTDDRVIGHWRVWHDRWTPLYASSGGTRCGMLTELRERELAETLNRSGMQLGWFVELNAWKREAEHDNFSRTQRRDFFFD
ncbi:hypothetical protein [Pelagibius marinus]|uniref:hypothetical protein n=1 Tax=Pelagibius marinus TaxID=2762760 RepID=UPI0018733A4C|nr:hypothetical protein [Pelagibius marinus]